MQTNSLFLLILLIISVKHTKELFDNFAYIPVDQYRCMHHLKVQSRGFKRNIQAWKKGNIT